MTRRHREIVQRELRAIKRTIARIEASFEGVPKLLRSVQLATVPKIARRAQREPAEEPSRVAARDVEARRARNR